MTKQLNLEVARQLFAFMHGDWLEHTLNQEARRLVASLVLGVYISHLEGKPVYKKKIGDIMGCEDLKTSRKYVALAHERGLISFERGPDDMRKEYLIPTDKLLRIVKNELSTIISAAH